MSFAQRPSRSFMVTATGKLFKLSDITGWATSNAANVTQLGNSYVVNSGNFGTVVGVTTPLAPTGTTPVVNTTLKDMGTTIRIGNQNEQSLIVLRKVQLPGLSGDNGTPVLPASTGYVVIENNASLDTFTTPANFSVYVARA